MSFFKKIKKSNYKVVLLVNDTELEIVSVPPKINNSSTIQNSLVSTKKSTTPKNLIEDYKIKFGEFIDAGKKYTNLEDFEQYTEIIFSQ